MKETIENEPIAQIAYVCVAPGDKKKVAYVTRFGCAQSICPCSRRLLSYSRLGLVWVHLFAVSKAKDAAAIVDVCLDRQKSAAEQRSLVPASGIDQMSAGIDDEEEEVRLAYGFVDCRPVGLVCCWWWLLYRD